MRNYFKITNLGCIRKKDLFFLNSQYDGGDHECHSRDEREEVDEGRLWLITRWNHFIFMMR